MYPESIIHPIFRFLLQAKNLQTERLVYWILLLKFQSIWSYYCLYS